MKKSIIERLEELVVDYKNYVKSLEKRIIELEMELEKNKNLKDFTCLSAGSPFFSEGKVLSRFGAKSFRGGEECGHN